MKKSLFYVMTAAPCSPDDARAVLFRFGCLPPQLPALLFLDLPDADAAKLPEDFSLLRVLRAGFSALSASAPRFLFIRRRVWNDAARLFLGTHQPLSPRIAAAQLLTAGKSACAFAYASVPPASLRGQADAVLFADASLSCLPDVPEALLHELPESGFLRARVLPRQLDDEPILSRLTAQDFSLCSPQEAASALLQKRRLALAEDGPLLCGPQALALLAAGNAPAFCPLSEQVFVRMHAPSCRMLAEEARQRFAAAWAAPKALFKRKDPALLSALLPLAQMLVLLLAALFGWAVPAYAAAFLPELWTLLLPRHIPGALVRLAFLPLTAAHALDTLLAQLLARSPALRIRLTGMAFSPAFCTFCGVLVILSAVRSVHALVPLLAVGLDWLSAPLLARALASPARERLPLSPVEQAELFLLARAAFPEEQPAFPARRLLSCCGGCMLGLLEPDEAARRVQALLPALKSAVLSPAGWACLCCTVQFLREHIRDCDASLRSLPAELDAQARTLFIQPDGGRLSPLLPPAVRRKGAAFSVSALDALFLPRKLAASLPLAGTALVLFLPHSFLKRALPDAQQPEDADARFLFLCAAALDRPFEKLFWRSPIAAPYAPLLSLASPRAD